MFLNDYASQISLDVIDLAEENNICLICLPPHTSHAFQPLDKGIYGTAKKAWKLIFKDYFLLGRNKNVTKQDFPKLLNKLYQEAFN